MACLAFADGVCVPSRHILEGDAMAEAIAWAVPLLEAGIVVPTRRVEAALVLRNDLSDGVPSPDGDHSR
ncbi:MAG: hypothetical protein SYR96_17610 [Actinomycetota bacterium]|nr:hypothetical protein [Actinomycetota bacterium]